MEFIPAIPRIARLAKIAGLHRSGRVWVLFRLIKKRLANTACQDTFVSLFHKKIEAMGLVYADIELTNIKDKHLAEEGYLPVENIRRMTATMMADSGAIMMAINEDIQAQMGFAFIETMAVQLADSTPLELDVVGPIEVRLGRRRATVTALVLPGSAEPLFGAIPMEYMDLIVDPAARTLGPHPSRPIRPVVSLK